MSTIKQLHLELQKLCDENCGDYEAVLDLRGLLQPPHNMSISLSDECERFDHSRKLVYISARLKEK